MTPDMDDAVRNAVGSILDLAPSTPHEPVERPHRGAGPHRTRVLAFAAAVVVVAGTVGLVALGDRSGEDRSADQPNVQTTTAPLVVDELGPLPNAPELFPVFAQGDPRNEGATGSYSQLDPNNPPQTTVGLARRAGDRLVDGITVTGYAEWPSDLLSGTTPTPITIDGIDYDTYTEPGTPAITTIAIPGALPILVSGLDPVSFVKDVGAESFDAKIGTSAGSGQVVVTVHTVPDGYETIEQQTPLPRGAREATLHIPAADAEDGALITVAVRPETGHLAVVAPLHPVDINGIQGWASQSAGHAVTWQIGPTTWVTVGGVDNTEDALRIARDLRFVDEESWRATYGVTEPSFPPAPRYPHNDPSSSEPLPTADSVPDAQTASPDLGGSFPLDGVDPYDAAAALFLDARIGPNPDEQADLEAAGEILVRECLRTGGASPPAVTADEHRAFRDNLTDGYTLRTNGFTSAGLEYRRHNGFLRQAEPFDPNGDTPLHLTIEEGSTEEQLMLDGCGSADNAVRERPSEDALRTSTFENSDTRWYSLGPADLPQFADGYQAYDECMEAAGYDNHDAVGPNNPFTDLFHNPIYTDEERDAVNADADCRVSTDLPTNYLAALAPVLDDFDNTHDSQIFAIQAERKASLDTARSILREAGIEPLTS